MRKLLVAALVFVLLAEGVLAQGSGPPCRSRRPGSKFQFTGACTFTDDGSFEQCFSMIDGSDQCWLFPPPVSEVLDSNGDPIEDDTSPTTSILGSDSIEWRRGAGPGEIYPRVRLTYDFPMLDEAWAAATLNAVTTNNGGVIDATVTIDSNGGFQDVSANPLSFGACVSYTYTVAMATTSKQYFKWKGGSSTGSDAAAQDEAEGRYHCPTGFSLFGFSLETGGVQTAIPASATVTFGVTINNTDGNTLCTLTNSDGATGETCVPAEDKSPDATANELSNPWFLCTGAGCSGAAYEISVNVCCR